MTKRSRRNKSIGPTVAAVALLAALLLLPAVAEARVGSLDPTFGEAGRVTTPFRISSSTLMAVDRDGSTVFLGGGFLTRFLPDGRPDPGFGTDGRVVFSGEVEGLRLHPEAIALDSQGRMVVFGVAYDPDLEFHEDLLHIPSTWAIVLRLTRDGALDPSFGDGKGFVRGAFGQHPDFETDLPLFWTAGGQVDSQDRPIFIIQADGLTGSCNYGHTGITPYPRAVVRLTVAGELDPGFGGGDGISPVSGSEQRPLLGLDGAGNPAVAVGTEKNCRQGGTRVLRLSADGSFPLAGFGTGGTRRYPGLLFSLIEPSGAMILREGALLTKAVARTEADGDLDESFGKEGIARVRMPAGADPRLEPVGVDAQGRLLLVGAFSLPKPQKRGHGDHRSTRRPRRDFLAVTRLLASGATDTGFGKGGWILTRFTKPRAITAEGAALDPQGRLVVLVSSGSAGQPPGSQPVVVRYLLDG